MGAGNLPWESGFNSAVRPFELKVEEELEIQPVSRPHPANRGAGLREGSLAHGQHISAPSSGLCLDPDGHFSLGTSAQKWCGDENRSCEAPDAFPQNSSVKAPRSEALDPLTKHMRPAEISLELGSRLLSNGY